MIDLHALSMADVFWTLVGVIVILGFLAFVAKGVWESRYQPTAADLADDSMIDYSLIAPRHDFTQFPVERSAVRLDPRNYTTFEVSHDVLLSKLARALKTEGLVISNTPRGTLRVHDRPMWEPAPDYPKGDELIPTLLQKQAG